MEYVTHDEMINLINFFMPFFALFFAASLVVCFHIIKVLIDNLSFFYDVLKNRSK